MQDGGESALKKIAGLRVTYMDPGKLKPYEKNARVHPKKQVRLIAESIKALGFNVPILINETGTILSGHGRLEAAKLLGMDQVPCVRLEHLTQAEQRAFIIADNALATKSSWDEVILGEELSELSLVDKGFNLEVTGFSIAEVDSLVEGLAVEEGNDPRNDEVPPLRPDVPVTKPGDLWTLGPHRLLCQSALSPDACSKLMEGELARLVLTDPPFNVRIQGHVSGLGSTRHREFAMASGEMSKDQFVAFLKAAFENLGHSSLDGSIHLISMDWRHVSEILAAAEGVYDELKNIIVWVKDNGGMGTFYRSRHELIFAFKKGQSPHTNSFELGQHGRYRTNVWNYRGMNSFGGSRQQDLALHPTVKPVSMLADAIKDLSGRGDIILDTFGGSGSTLIAAHRTGRRCRMMEIDPIYCDCIIRRWQKVSKDDAIHTETGKSFAEMEKR